MARSGFQLSSNNRFSLLQSSSSEQTCRISGIGSLFLAFVYTEVCHVLCINSTVDTCSPYCDSLGL